MAKQTIIPPEGGWKEHTLYLVECSYFAQNPVHRALFHCVFVKNGRPGNYNGVTQFGCGDNSFVTINNIYYMRVIRALTEPGEMCIVPNCRMPPCPENDLR